jgi:CHAT domain-containing protein
LLRTSQQQLTETHYEQAYQTARQALTLSQRRGDKLRQVRAANLLAIASLYLGRANEALDYFKQTSLAAAEKGLGPLQTTALSRAGSLLMLSGRYADALFCFQQGLQSARQRKDRDDEARLLTKLGALYAETADYAKATEYLQTALKLVQAQADKAGVATILRKLVVVEKGRGALESALQYGERALALMRRPERSLAGMELLYHLGTVYAALDQPQKAAELFEQARQLARALQTPRPEAFILGDFAATQLKSGDAMAARNSATQSLALLRRSGGNKHFESRISATLAEAQRALGQREEALSSYRAALAALEEARVLSIPTEISRAGIVARHHQIFAGAIALLLNLARPAEAFDVAESYHARAFLDVLAESGLDAVTELNPSQQAREDQLFEQISGIQQQLWQPDLPAEQAEKLNHELAGAENALELFRLELRRADPRYARIKAPPPLSHGRVATELLEAQTAQTALIEYVVSDEQSFAWVVTQGQVHSVTLPGGKELAEAITAYRTTASSKVASSQAAAAMAKLKTQSQPLYQQLFAPLEPHLKAARKLIIVTDGPLAYLPFEALAGAPQRAAPFLLERFAISYAPSASALAALRSLKPNHTVSSKDVAAFGDPVYAATNNELRQLPYTRHEVNAIAALFQPAQSRVWLGAEANEPNVKAGELHQYRYVHFATHALIDETHPARSGIVLAQAEKEDGSLQMSEVMRLKLNADLVTLSACRTGLGQMLRGEGIIGLTRSFLYAGAESVAVSLWNVNDIATASLMQAFYQNLQRGLAKDDALRQAKLELLKGRQPAWRHPYYWAAFVLVGDSQ